MQTMAQLGAMNHPLPDPAWHDKRFTTFKAMQALARQFRG